MSDPSAPGLEVRDLAVSYGGLDALDGLSLDVASGQIVGLIGPNGAGKTTAFNALTALVRPTRGTVRLFGQDLGRSSPSARARLGLGRTFQRFELLDSMTVADNVRIGKEARLAGARPGRHVVAGRPERRVVEAAVGEAIELCGLAAFATTPAGALSTGQRRLVELARAVAADFRILLLDEPSSGLDVVETRAFGEILVELGSRGVGMLLVEHDMALVMRLCSYIHVIDFGIPLFAGTPTEVSNSEEVRRAYLGAEV